MYIECVCAAFSYFNGVGTYLVEIETAAGCNVGEELVSRELAQHQADVMSYGESESSSGHALSFKLKDVSATSLQYPPMELDLSVGDYADVQLLHVECKALG